MTTEDKKQAENDITASVLFSRDLALFGNVKEALLGLDSTAYPDFDMVLNWVEAAENYAIFNETLPHDIAWKAFMRCFVAYKNSCVGLIRSDFFPILDSAVKREIDTLANELSEDACTAKRGGRPPRKEASDVMRLG
ncbi:hypothetical protein [Acetobacter senegalensis]